MHLRGQIPCCSKNFTKGKPFEVTLKDGDELNATGRGRKRKAESESVLVETNKKPKIEEGFQGQSVEKTPSSTREESSSTDSFYSAKSNEEYWKLSKEDFEDLYEEKHRLGKGSFGEVFAGIRKCDGLPVALKHIPKGKVIYNKDDEQKFDIYEAQLMMHAAGRGVKYCKYNPGVIELIDVLELEEEVIIVMELPNDAMDLYEYIKQNPVMEEQEVKVIFKQIISAAAIMHKNEVFHRDIKTSNILISNTDVVPRVKIIDFGCGEWVQDEPYYGFAGTRKYAPPEYFFKNYSHAESTTVWQLGLVLFHMCELNNGTTFEYLKLEGQTISGLSRVGNDFLKECLRINPDLRLELEELLEHPWLKD